MIKKYNILGDDFTAAGEASSDFKGILKKLGISPEVIRKVSIAMYEAEINTIIHGGGGECVAEIEGKSIRVTFSDNGPGIANLDLAMQEGYSTASDKIREMGFGAGMGLPNMKKYTDEMEITTKIGEGTTVDMTVYIR